jgi:hypothetical protein
MEESYRKYKLERERDSESERRAPRYMMASRPVEAMMHRPGVVMMAPGVAMMPHPVMAMMPRPPMAMMPHPTVAMAINARHRVEPPKYAYAYVERDPPKYAYAHAVLPPPIIEAASSKVIITVIEYELDGYGPEGDRDITIQPNLYSTLLKPVKDRECGLISSDKLPLAAQTTKLRSCDVLSGILSDTQGTDAGVREMTASIPLTFDIKGTVLPKLNLDFFLRIMAKYPTKLAIRPTTSDISSQVPSSNLVIYKPDFIGLISNLMIESLNLHWSLTAKDPNPDDDKTLIKVISPTTEEKYIIVGDLHGSLGTFIRLMYRWRKLGLMNENGKVTDTYNIVFLGDICDRGVWGYEICIILFYLFLANNKDGKNKIYLNRGNHEEQNVNIVYGLQKDFSKIFDRSKSEVITENFFKINDVFKLMHSALVITNPYDKSKFAYLTHGGYPLVGDNCETAVVAIPKASRIVDNSRISQGSNNTVRWNDYHGHNESSSSYGRACKIGADMIYSAQKQGCQFTVRAHQDTENNTKLLIKGHGGPIDIRKYVDTCPNKISRQCVGPIANLEVNGETSVVTINNKRDDTILPVLTLSTNTEYGRDLFRDSFVVLRFSK